MTIKTLIPDQQNGKNQLEQWREKREEIKRRFQENIGRPNFPRTPRDIETPLKPRLQKAIHGANYATGLVRMKRYGHIFWFRTG
jgi:hypothetical protein